MKILHILKSVPDEETKILIDRISREEETKEVKLYEGQLDYRELVNLIFSYDKVICWW
jgi:hypothetical protein